MKRRAGAHLTRRGLTYSFRMRVPDRLWVALKRAKVVRAIGSGVVVARCVAAQVGARIGALWQASDVMAKRTETQRTPG
ncbi:DUF6538 domain-containing protein [Roseococcus sp. DSY-14]|uniref:DUF6538 domain-containing protein n=1 Tax=Roseococcus sp. DSY-14 TaxID=3369650 RepID=UPI00387B35AB